MTTQYVYLACAEDGLIAVYRIDGEKRALQLVQQMAAGSAVMPLALDLTTRRLFAMTRKAPFTFLTFSIDESDGTLRCIASHPLSHSYVYFTKLPERAVIVGASYGEHVIGLIPLGDREKPDDQMQKQNPAESWTQSVGRHPHCVIATADRGQGSHLYVTFLGDDRIHFYAMQKGADHPVVIEQMAVRAHTGPRHAVLSENARFLYVLGELSGVVWVFARDLMTGRLTPQQEVATIAPELALRPGKIRAPGALNADENDLIWSADIRLSPNGRFLYTSERSSGTICQLSVDLESGMLRYMGTVTTAVGARSLAITDEGDYLLAASTTSSRLQLFAIDQRDGALSRVDDLACPEGAAWIETLTL